MAAHVEALQLPSACGEDGSADGGDDAGFARGQEVQAAIVIPETDSETDDIETPVRGRPRPPPPLKRRRINERLGRRVEGAADGIEW